MPPPRKGADPFFIQVLKLPFTIGWIIVFTPAHWFMWFLVDKVGDNHADSKNGAGAIWISKWVMRKQKDKSIPLHPIQKWGQTWVLFAKEFRYVLCDYVGWARISSPKWRCKFCSKEGSWWCVECKKKHCAQCAYNQHAPKTIANIHSLEKMKTPEETGGLHIITPILPDLMFLAFFYYLLFHVELMGPDYLTTQITCPVVSKVRGFTASVDANLFYYYKQSFFAWCDVEDSFFRFISDTWVRGIVMQKDNTLLVFQTLPAALLVNAGLRYTLVPIASIFYAILASLIYAVESRIDVDRTEDPKPFLVQLEEFFQTWNGSVFFGVGTRSDLPPPTHRRTRDALDPLEELWYIRDRRFRVLRYYRESTRMALMNLTWQTLMATLCVRLSCIWLNGVASTLKFVLGCVGFQSLITAQEQWYAGQWNIVDERFLRGIAAYAYSLADSWLVLLPDSLKRLSYLWLVLLVLWVTFVTAGSTYLVYYRRGFMKEWIGDKSGCEMDNHMDFGQECYWMPKPKEENGKDADKTPAGRRAFTSRGSVAFLPVPE